LVLISSVKTAGGTLQVIAQVADPDAIQTILSHRG
jgi:hypothetical protein